MALNLLWYFIFYAFLGWCTEVVYAAVNTGHFTNRGFLNGPYCPIYGFGVLFVISLLYPVKDNLLYMFVGSVLITSTIEFTAGYVLEKIFHQKLVGLYRQAFEYTRLHLFTVLSHMGSCMSCDR